MSYVIFEFLPVPVCFDVHHYLENLPTGRQVVGWSRGLRLTRLVHRNPFDVSRCLYRVFDAHHVWFPIKSGVFAIYFITGFSTNDASHAICFVFFVVKGFTPLTRNQ